MKVISLNGLTKRLFENTCAAIGVFDGVHLGHQYLIGKMLATARRLCLRGVVVTFYPHPASVLRPDIKFTYLTSLKDRLELLADLGVDTCVIVEFDKDFARILPRNFIEEVLLSKLGVQALFVGDDFRFGKDRQGDVGLLEDLGHKLGYKTYALKGLKKGKTTISSTVIRKMVTLGKLKQAALFLGRPFFVTGCVVKGARRGRLLGFPTANISYEADILPPGGVYVVRVFIKGNEYQGVANVGRRPSFESQKQQLHLEVHLLDFSGNIYRQQLKVEFLKKIRHEKKFVTPQALIRQIHKDIIIARAYFGRLRKEV